MMMAHSSPHTANLPLADTSTYSTEGVREGGEEITAMGSVTQLIVGWIILSISLVLFLASEVSFLKAYNKQHHRHLQQQQLHQQQEKQQQLEQQQQQYGRREGTNATGQTEGQIEHTHKQHEQVDENCRGVCTYTSPQEHEACGGAAVRRTAVPPQTVVHPAQTNSFSNDPSSPLLSASPTFCPSPPFFLTEDSTDEYTPHTPTHIQPKRSLHYNTHTHTTPQMSSCSICKHTVMFFKKTLRQLSVLIFPFLSSRCGAPPPPLQQNAACLVKWLVVGVAAWVSVWLTWGKLAALFWLNGYVLEWCLSIDNLMVFHFLFSAFHTPKWQMRKALVFGLVGAVLFRLVFFCAGVVMLKRLWFVSLIFGGFLVYTGGMAMFDKECQPDHEQRGVVKWVCRILPVWPHFDSKGRFFVCVDEAIPNPHERLSLLDVAPDPPSTTDTDTYHPTLTSSTCPSSASLPSSPTDVHTPRSHTDTHPYQPDDWLQDDQESVGAVNGRGMKEGSSRVWADGRVVKAVGEITQTEEDASGMGDGGERRGGGVKEEFDIRAERGEMMLGVREHVDTGESCTIIDRSATFSHTGKRSATMLVVVVCCLEFVDILFAVDSTAAKLALIPDLFISYSSTVVAMFGIRAMFFLIEQLTSYFKLLKYGLSLIMVFIGLKMMMDRYIPIPTWVFVSLVFFVLAVSVLLSVVYGYQTKQIANSRQEKNQMASVSAAGLTSTCDYVHGNSNAGSDVEGCRAHNTGPCSEYSTTGILASHPTPSMASTPPTSAPTRRLGRDNSQSHEAESLCGGVEGAGRVGKMKDYRTDGGTGRLRVIEEIEEEVTDDECDEMSASYKTSSDDSSQDNQRGGGGSRGTYNNNMEEGAGPARDLCPSHTTTSHFNSIRTNINMTMTDCNNDLSLCPTTSALHSCLTTQPNRPSFYPSPQFSSVSPWPPSSPNPIDLLDDLAGSLHADVRVSHTTLHGGGRHVGGGRGLSEHVAVTSQ
eukprot:GHVQ01003298.1.p1 GENE.GHVQ01003298.1~~GHVQ01003298.1.p1  ORF type:complete len:984 (+),score=229.20 GHVQ01003298.1:125-3076(+)